MRCPPRNGYGPVSESNKAKSRPVPRARKDSAVRFAKQLLVVLPVVLGASVLTTAAQAAAPPADTGASHGCVNVRTGVLRVVDPAKGQSCITNNGRYNESAIEWTQSAGTQPLDLSTSGSGDSLGIEYLDQLSGMPCNMNSTQPGSVHIVYSAAGAITMTCQKSSTSTGTTADTTGSSQTTDTTTTTATPPSPSKPPA